MLHDKRIREKKTKIYLSKEVILMIITAYISVTTYVVFPGIYNYLPSLLIPLFSLPSISTTGGHGSSPDRVTQTFIS